MFCKKTQSCLIALLLAGGLPESHATNLVWDDEGNSADKTWSNFGNWSPDNLPDGNDDLFIGVTAGGINLLNAGNDATVLDDRFRVNSITLGNGADITTSDDGGTTTYELQVDQDVTIGNGTGNSVLRLYERPNATQESLDANTLTINSGGQVILISNLALGGRNAVLEVDSGLLNNNLGGTLFGMGEIWLNDNTIAAPTTLLKNDGILTAGYSGGGIVFFPPASTLHFTAVNADARMDLDGASGNGVVNVNRNATLDIDVTIGNNGIVDAFSGTMNLAANSTLDIKDAWLFNGQMNVNTPGSIFNPPVPGSPANISGGQLTMIGGTITLDTGDIDSLQFNNVFNATGGTIANSGKIIFNNTATIGVGVDFQMSGVDASIVVNPGVTVTVNDQDFNLDGAGAATNVITIGDGGRLNLNLNNFDGITDRADGVLNLNSGHLALTVADNSWVMARDLNLNRTGGAAPRVTGSEMVVGTGFSAIKSRVNVTGTGLSTITAPVVFRSDAEVSIAADSILQTRTVTFESVSGADNASFTGTGKWRFTGTTTVDESTTIDMTGGTVDLDGSDIFLSSANSTHINAPLMINAANLQDFGNTSINVFPLPPSVSQINVNNVVNTGTLTVNLDDPSGNWTVNSVGVINLSNSNAVSTLLQGSDLNLEGTMNVTGDVRTAMRLDIVGEVNLSTANQGLRLNGGNNTTAPNTIAGGTINGPGRLVLDISRSLHGHGDINAPVSMGIGGTLYADNGTLNVNGPILDGRILGTADTDGILNVTNPWNSIVVTHVLLNGGELTGSQIINDNNLGIRGSGLISAPVINNTEIVAQGGNLVLENQAAVSLDGALNTGTLYARTGNLTVAYPSNTFVDFRGNVRVDAGHEFFGDRTLMAFQPSSLLELNGGTYRSNRSTLFGGAVIATAGFDSTVSNPNLLRFESSSTTTLDGNLAMVGLIEIESGATFAGGGTLANAAGSTLQIADGAAVDVLLENEGTLSLGNSPGQTTGLDFQQNAGGTWELEIGGLGLNEFDRMNLSGAASLDGTLEISTILGFVPIIGDTFNILSAAGGVAGNFSLVVDPAGLPAYTSFEVNYLGSIVQLEVIELDVIPGDFDIDGDVDDDDLLKWEGDYAGPGSDADGDGDSDGNDFLVWQRNFGSSIPAVATLTASNSTVPEPSSLLLACFASIGGLFTRRKKK